ncbi:MAG: T9SS type A sorting domain-containing protein [Bacteroidia bacterium]|nr:T9SS type A sorting domain-containing protein [Bacteroidia bacterium]
MRLLLLLLLFPLFVLKGFGQQILQQDFNPGGGVLNGNGNSISFSIGQPLYSEIINGSTSINGGFQQGLSTFPISVSTDSVDCNGTQTGAAGLTILGGSPNYTIQWSSGQSDTDSVYGLSAGIYQVTVIDAFGMQSDTTFEIQEPPVLSAISASYPESLTACLDGIAQFDMIVTGGTLPYTYSWSNSQDIIGETNVPNPIFYPINTFSYLVVVNDFHGCTVSANQNLEVSTTGGWFEGTITYGGVPVGAGDVEVFLFPTDYALGALENYDLVPNIDTLNFPRSAFTDANGRYRIQGNLDDVFYYLLARPRNISNIPLAVCTYFDFDTIPVYLWQNADSVFSNCGDTTTLNFPLVEVEPHSGPGRVWGYIRWDNAYGKTETSNDPIPLIDVVIEKDSVPSRLIDYTQTDNNGYYEFNNLPADIVGGDCYRIYVNYAGLEHFNSAMPGTPDQTYTPCLNFNDSVEGELNFWIDTLNAPGSDVAPGIYMNNNPTPDGIDEDNLANWVQIYPNPADDYMSVKIRNAEFRPVSIKIHDVAGKLVFEQFNYSKNELILTPEQIVPGMYMIEIERNGHQYFNKIVFE